MNINKGFKQKMIDTCDKKILEKGSSVSISFYVFFKNKNDDPELLHTVATWWIMTHRLNHFEKAIKIKELLNNE